MDSSFLFLPFGNDLLVVALVARHHDGLPFYVLSAVCGSTAGVFLLDLIARKGGEAGVQKVAGQSKFERLKRKVSEKGGRALVVGSLAPPPFPFTMVVATTSALGYPRHKAFCPESQNPVPSPVGGGMQNCASVRRAVRTVEYRRKRIGASWLINLY